MKTNVIIEGDCLTVLPTMEDNSVDCVVTSPPYWNLRDYGVSGQVGLEDDPQDYVDTMVRIFREIRRILKNTGTCWVNLGDTYANNGTGGNGATGGRDKSTLQSPMSPVGTTPVHRRIPAGIKAKDIVGIPWRGRWGAGTSELSLIRCILKWPRGVFRIYCFNL